MYMYVHIESPIMCPYKNDIPREERVKRREEKNQEKKKLIYVLYEYLVFTSIIQYIIIIESKVEKEEVKKKNACVPTCVRTCVYTFNIHVCNGARFFNQVKCRLLL